MSSSAWSPPPNGHNNHMINGNQSSIEPDYPTSTSEQHNCFNPFEWPSSSIAPDDNNNNDCIDPVLLGPSERQSSPRRHHPNGLAPVAMMTPNVPSAAYGGLSYVPQEFDDPWALQYPPPSIASHTNNPYPVNPYLYGEGFADQPFGYQDIAFGQGRQQNLRPRRPFPCNPNLQHLSLAGALSPSGPVVTKFSSQYIFGRSPPQEYVPQWQAPTAPMRIPNHSLSLKLTPTPSFKDNQDDETLGSPVKDEAAEVSPRESRYQLRRKRSSADSRARPTRTKRAARAEPSTLGAADNADRRKYPDPFFQLLPLLASKRSPPQSPSEARVERVFQESIVSPHPAEAGEGDTLPLPLKKRTTEGDVCEWCGGHRSKEPEAAHCARCIAKDERASAGTPNIYRWGQIDSAQIARHLYPELSGIGKMDDANPDDLKDDRSVGELCDKWVAKFLAAIETPLPSNGQVVANPKDEPTFERKQQRVLWGAMQCDSKRRHEPYHAFQIHLRLHQLFVQVYRFHNGGQTVIPVGGDNAGYGKPQYELSFIKRLEAIESFFKKNKLIVMDTIEFRGVAALIENPDAYDKRKTQNRNSNTKKGATLDAVKKERESAKTSGADSGIEKEEPADTKTEYRPPQTGRKGKRKAVSEQSRAPAKKKVKAVPKDDPKDEENSTPELEPDPSLEPEQNGNLIPDPEQLPEPGWYHDSTLDLNDEHPHSFEGWNESQTAMGAGARTLADMLREYPFNNGHDASGVYDPNDNLDNPVQPFWHADGSYGSL